MEKIAELHPQMLEILAMIKRDMAGVSAVNQMTPAAAREFFENVAHFWNKGGPELPSKRLSVPSPNGDIPVRFYAPATPRESPCLVYVHGGGWVLGSTWTHDGVCRRLASYGNFPVVSIDYRLAPENKFPAALDDCLATVRWIYDRGKELGIDGTRLAVAGDSAGANLSLAVTMSLRDSSGPKLKAAALIYGAFGVDFDTPSYRAYGTDQYLLPRSEMLWYWEHYLRCDADRRDPRAVPLAGSFENLPPLLVIGAEFDPLLDDSLLLLVPGITNLCRQRCW